MTDMTDTHTPPVRRDLGFLAQRVLGPAVALAAALAIAPSCGRSGGDDDAEAPAATAAVEDEASAQPAGGGGEVVLYYSADDVVARPIIEMFEKRTGVRVLGHTDTEATKNTGLVQRLIIEKERPRADVFWSSEVFLTLRLAEEGVLAPHESEAVADWPAALRDDERLWHGFAQRARVVVFNTKRVPADEAPRTMLELTRPRWKDRVVMARPQFGTTRGHMGAVLALWGPDTMRSWLIPLKANGVRLLDGNSAVVRAVAMGEADIGLTDTDDVWMGQRNDWPVDLVYVRHDVPGHVSAGPLVIPNTVSRIRGGPNERNAHLLIDFLLSEEVERALAESESHNIPIRPELAAEFPKYAVPDPAAIDFAKVAASLDEAMNLCDRALGP